MALSDSIYNTIDNPTYKNILGTIGDVTQSTASVTRKIRSFNGDEMTPAKIRDYNTNGFLAQESSFVPFFFARMFDEPTYLTFKIEFMFNDPENDARNTAYNNSGILSSTKTSVYYPIMYDNMPEPFLDDYIVNGESDGSTGKRYSTEAYLDLNLGDHGRAQILHNFKMALKDIEKNFPFYFTSISGIDSLAKVVPEQGIRLKDCKIELECLEGLDLKITQLLQMYRKIVWDDVYQRWILPDMMRYFGMRIYISEMRLFGSVKKESDLGPKAYTFSNADVRNMTYTKKDADFWTETTRNIVNSANAVSQTFLGTKSIITKALDYTASTLTTIDEGYQQIKGAFNQVQYCNNAINEIMPTLCFECHMCEFDIEDTLSHINNLSSSRKGANEVKPKIKIKVGQVREMQSYPLNTSLIGTESEGYLKNIKDYILGAIPPLMQADNYRNIYKLRGDYDSANKKYNNGNLTFAGGYMSDKTLLRKYTSGDLVSRILEYINNLSTDFGLTKGQLISERRFNTPNNPSDPNIIDDFYKMKYRPDDLPSTTASISLFTAAMNEALAIAYHANVNSEYVGTRSLATNQTNTVKNSLNAIGDMMMAALDRIYHGQELKSMAVQGIPEETRARLASNSFNAFLENVEKSEATQNPAMREFLKNYRMIEKTEYQSKATNTKFSNLN